MEWINHSAGSGAGYGDCNGSGDGYGDCNGSGDGYGDGYGDGAGSCAGSGDGYGSGVGYGSGDGYGDCNGSGVGSGDGNCAGVGSGDGDGEYYFQCLILKLDALHSEQRERLNQENQNGMVLALWRSKKDGTPSNGGKLSPAIPFRIDKVSGPLKLCSSKALHGTLNPHKWEGEKIWIVGLYPPVHFGESKMGSLKREIICETDWEI